MWKVIEGDFIDNEELHAPFPKFYEAFGPVTIPQRGAVDCCLILVQERQKKSAQTQRNQLKKEIPKTVQEFTMHFYLKIDIIRSVVRMQDSYIQKTVFVSEGGCFYAGCL